jgi:hypothetical protein
MGTESLLPGGKRRSHKADHSAPPTAEVNNNCHYISTPAIRHHGVQTNKFTHLCLHSYRMLVGKPEGKRPLGRPRRRWEDNIKMDLQEVGGGREDWIELAQDRDRWRHLWVR